MNIIFHIYSNLFKYLNICVTVFWTIIMIFAIFGNFRQFGPFGAFLDHFVHFDLFSIIFNQFWPFLKTNLLNIWGKSKFE